MKIQKIKQYLFSPRFHFNRFEFNLVALFFISAGVILGSYLALSKAIPFIFALNDTNKVWTFNSSTATDYTYDNTLITVDNTGAHPVSTVNKLSNPAFASNNTSWSVAAVPPSGWVEVPANATYSTTNFLAMKYEAKCAATSDLTTGLTSPENAGSVKTYNDTSTACTVGNSKAVVSVASGYPIANISQTNSITRCGTVSLGSTTAHLITNNEWMTAARNAEAQSSNWYGGAVGTNFMYSGHNDNGPATALVASTDDTLGYTGTGDSGSSCDGSSTNFAGGQDTTSGPACVGQKRTLSLSNGSTLWDFAGNVWEWNSNTILGKDEPTSGSPGFGWREFTAITTYGTLSYDLIRPLGSTYDYTKGIGRIYSDGTGSNNTTYAFLRGGDWDDGANAGAFTLYLDSAPSTVLTNVGFRCASDPVAISQSFSSSSGRNSAGGNSVTIGSVTDGKIYQSVNVGDTSTYDLSVYVYDTTSGNDGGTVNGSIAQLYYNNATVTTTYTSIGSGWWKLSGTLTGANASREYGLLVKAGKTVKTDDFTLSKQGTYSVYNTTAYSNAQVNSWDTFCEGSLSGSTCTADATYSGNAAIGYQVCLDDGSACSYSSGSRWRYYTAGAWTNATDATSTYTNTAAQLTQAAMQALSVTSQKISIKAIMGFGGADTSLMPHISIGLTTDTTAPTTNASSLAMTRSTAGTSVSSNDWTNGSSPYFSWTAGADNGGGSGLKGYCLYVGTDGSGDPATSKGLLGTSPVSTAGTTCQFIVTATSIDFATASYKGSPWLSTSSSPYYLRIKAVDNSGNTTASAAQFQFRFDNTAPTNTSFISCASGSFSNVADMSFNWPTSGGTAASDANAGILGWQYQINSTVGTWLGTTTSTPLALNYITTSDSSRTLTQGQDGSSIVSGTNVIYFKAIDNAGNTATEIRTCNIAYGGAAPAFGGSDSVTVSPSSSTANSFALSWPAATATIGQTVAHYYYMINTTPPSTLSTLQGNAATYIDNGTTRTVSAAALPNVNKGANTVYVVAVDNASTPNYSPSNVITGTFTLNSTDPDNVGNLTASDSSIKSESRWMVTLSWTAPSYQGAGNLTYLIYRSSDGSSFSQVGSTSGLSYVDTTSSSAQYYYKVYSKDGANAQSSGTNAVSITPTGRWTSAPSLSSGPTVGSITTRKATITWSTSRSSDSKISYGTTSGNYGSVDASNTDQVTSHSITLSNLSAGQNYYYKAKWTDEDGNTGESEEKSFNTAAAPTVKDVAAKNIGLAGAIIEFTSNAASKVKIYYGPTTSFGGTKEIPTSISETTYTAQLIGLTDGTKYYYKINTFDSDNTEYEGTVLDFTTLPRPRITNVRIQQVTNTAQSTILVSWTTNTEISSIVTYYPQDDPSKAQDSVNVALTKGEHKMIIRSLFPQTDYLLIVKGRDRIGNEATSDSQRVTTATDTRPPLISSLNVEGSNVPQVSSNGQESTAQLVVSWNTDEPSTSQVEFGEGTGSNYSSKTQEDSNLTVNHLVIISGLTPSKVYHLRAIAKDKASNVGNSIDTVTITPKTTDNALNLVISNLQEAFGFLGGVFK